MKFLADECCDALVVAGLRGDGHDVVWASESCQGAEDAEVLRLAADRGRVVLTEDKDFGESWCGSACPRAESSRSG